MRRTQRWRDFEDEETSANRQTQSLAGLAISLFLVVVSLGLIHILHKKAMIEDCVLSGRTNCGRDWSYPMSVEREIQVTAGLPPD
jgi:hypothetical protein